MAQGGIDGVAAPPWTLGSGERQGAPRGGGAEVVQCILVDLSKKQLYGFSKEPAPKLIHNHIFLIFPATSFGPE